MPGPKTGAQRAKLSKHLRVEKRHAPTNPEDDPRVYQWEENVRGREG